MAQIWYRDLPTPILNELPAEAVCNSTDFQVCVDAYDTLKEPQVSPTPHAFRFFKNSLASFIFLGVSTSDLSWAGCWT